MRLHVSHHLDTDRVTVTLVFSHESIVEARNPVPQIMDHETPTMFLVRVADWIGTLPVHEQMMEVEGPPEPRPTAEELHEQDFAVDAANLRADGAPVDYPPPPDPDAPERF